MDWITIISIVLGEGVLAFVVGILTIRSTKRKAEAEADMAKAEAEKAKREAEKAKVEADNAIVAPLREANEILRGQLVEANARISELVDMTSTLVAEKDTLHDKNEELYEKNEALAAENAAVKQLICVHGGCGIREPIRGMGAKWFEEHRDIANLGIDTLSINQLLVQYGRKKAAKKEEELND